MAGSSPVTVHTPLNQIPGKLEVYELLIQEARSIFELDGIRLDDAIKSQVQNLGLYDGMLQECKTIEAFLEMRRDEVEAERHKHYLENSNRQLSARDMAMYIRGDPQLIAVAQILVDVAHVRRQLESIVETLQGMGWSLSNIVKLRIAQLENIVL